MFRAPILLLACLVSGCASITTGQNQTLSVEAPGCPEASCVLSNNDGTFYVNRTPGTTMVNKSCSKLTVSCSRPGFPDHVEHFSAGFQSMTVGNVLIGGLVGAGVDAFTGAACKYPSVISVGMECLEPTDLAAAGAVEAAPMDSDIPLYVWDAAFDGLCGDVEPLDDAGSDETYLAICQSEKTLITCVDKECSLSEYSGESGSGNMEF